MDTPINHAQLDAVLAGTALGASASDLHGSLTGYLCGGGRAGPRHVLEALELESDDAPIDDRAHALLERLYRQCLQQLDDPDLGFEPLLPADEQPLPERADALVEWCRGFLGGFGLGGASSARLSADGNEVLRDLGTIAGSRLQMEAGAGEGDERALMEVLEFVRIGALLLHAELTAAAPPPTGSLH